MKPLALTALVHEGPMARAYLGVLQAAGYRLERIVLMVGKRDASHGRPVAPWLPKSLRRPIARMVQDFRMNHWPRELVRTRATRIRPWLDNIAQVYGFDPACYESLIERPDYARYANRVDEVFVDGLSDPSLKDHLAGLPRPCTLLFTGGGMVPAALLDIAQCRIIHVHPGVLPNVRGADGLLWSLLLRGHPGATVFYMSPGLDAGNVIRTQDLEVPPPPKDLADLDTATTYRLLYSFVDPMMRAVTLRQVIDDAGSDLSNLHCVPQQAHEGATFHFMNDRLRRFVFSRWPELVSARRVSEPSQ